MSPLQEKPILHGRDHCPGGADPIPCMISGPSGDFEGVLLGTGPYAYWRLGETGTPWADTSGIAPAADLTLAGSGTAMTPDVTGALASGDDGAVEFNYDGSASAGGEVLYNDGTGKDFGLTLGEMSVAAWVRVKASALSRTGVIIGNSEHAVAGGSHTTGWGLHVVYPGRSVRFSRGHVIFPGPELYAETTAGVAANTWVFIVGTYDGANIKLYANAELQDTTADPSGAGYAIDKIFVGTAAVSGDVSTTNSWFYGSVDEAAVWTRALSQAEIDAIYTAGVSGAGVGEQVLLSDGAGGTYWGQAGGAAIADEAIVDRHVADGADIDPLKLEHPGGTTSFLRADGTWASVSSDPTTDTLVWMPLADSDGILVLDADDAVIPTLIPI